MDWSLLKKRHGALSREKGKRVPSPRRPARSITRTNGRPSDTRFVTSVYEHVTKRDYTRVYRARVRQVVVGLGSVSNHSASQNAPPRDETKEEALAPVFAGARSSRRALFRGMRLAWWRQGSVAREGARHFVTDRPTDGQIRVRWTRWLTPTENKHH